MCIQLQWYCYMTKPNWVWGAMTIIHLKDTQSLSALVLGRKEKSRKSSQLQPEIVQSSKSMYIVLELI